MSPMRVGIVTPRYPPNVKGGGEISVKLLAESLAGSARVTNVTVLSFDGNRVDSRNGVEIHRLRRISATVTEWQNIVAGLSLHSQIGNYDVAHAYNMELHPIVGVLGPRRVDATVATLNSYHFLPKSVSNTDPSFPERVYELLGYPTTGRFMRNVMNRIDAFIPISSAVREVYSQHGIRGDKMEIIPNMLDPSFEVPTRDSGDGVTVLYVGEISGRKGVGTLVAAMAELPDRFSLRVVGDGPALDSLRRQVRDGVVENRVTFTGFVEYADIPNEYAAADIFVHPGIWPEPFGRTILEAMQAGLPVVCTDVGGPSDIVPDPAYRCSPNDPQALASTIRMAAREDGAGQRFREYAETEYAPSRVTKRVVDLYERLLDRDETDSAR